MTARTVRHTGLLAVLAVAAGGCVERKLIVESNVPNAQVYVDNKPLGAAPAYTQFDYYGHYEIMVVYPGYDTVMKREHLTAPWYAYPPFDLLSAVVPFPVRDTRRVYVELTESSPLRTDDLLMKADALRARGRALPPPETPALPRTKAPAPQPPPVVGPPPVVPVAPVPEPLPGPAPGVVPGVGPAAGPAPAAPTPRAFGSYTPGYTPTPAGPRLSPNPSAVPGLAPGVAPTPAPGVVPAVTPLDPSAR